MSELINSFRRSIFLLFIVSVVAFSQVVDEATRARANSELQKMSPDEIDALIKKYGMTRAEAEAKAKQNGIDLESYLKQLPGKSTPVLTTQSAPIANIPIPTQTSPKTEEAVPATLGNAAQVVNAPKPPQPLKVEESQIFGLSFFRSPANTFEASPSIADKDYILGAGDVLKISLWGQTQTMDEVTVDREGRITLVSVGPLLVSGYTIDEAKKRVKAALAHSYAGLESQPATIFLELSLSKLRPVRVFIMGEVNNPGGYFVNNFANVFNSLFVVGGPKASGSLRDVRVIRSGKLIAKVDLYDYLLGSVKTNDTRVNDNDIIFVPLKGRSISIRGEVLRPATYELQPDENLKKLLEYAGGVRSNVYRDRIQVDRIIPFAKRKKGDLERRMFDIEFADIATGKKDFTVEDGDIITLFPILDKKENYVRIAGDVKRPGTYQIDQLRTVKDLIDAADGLWPTAYLKRAELTRQYQSDKFEMITLDLEKVMQKNPQQNIALEMRDNLRIYSMYEINPVDFVSILGHVKSPGKFIFADSMTVSNMLRSVGGQEDSVFRANTFLDRADLVRLNEDLVTRRTIQLDIAKILAGEEKDIPLIQGDELRVYALGEIKFLDKKIQIYGHVKRPGEYRLIEKMTLTDLILQAGGFTEDAWTNQAEVARVMNTEMKNDSLVRILFSDMPNLFDATRTPIEILSSSKASSFVLQDKDQVFIRPNPNYRLQEQVTVAGEVKFPGAYALWEPRERISDVVRRAGGLKKTGYARGGQLIRGTTRFRTNIEEALHDERGTYDAILHPGDQVVIQRTPNSVEVLGEVNNPGKYSFVEGKSMKFYLDIAGGKTDSAYYALITLPEGFVEKYGFGWFSSNPSIPDGSMIYVVKLKPEPPEPVLKDKTTSTFDFVKDMLAIIVSSVTVIVLAKRL